jgi:peptidoglycan/LPS O-acetylase OafA/YrhL
MKVQKNLRFDWIDGLKAFAILGIILNHLSELYGNGPWFSMPSHSWPPLAERLSMVIPAGGNDWFKIFRFAGWLGDFCPGVFLLLSGFSLTLSQKNRQQTQVQAFPFYRERTLRLIPLYLLVHFAFLIVNKILDPTFNLATPKVLFSLAGLRWSGELFFFLNPSWWFIWVIIQLYIVFPVLYSLMCKDMRRFLVLSLIITVASRLFGLIAMKDMHHLYYWMTGQFFGTRLFEFAVGMYFASLFTDKQLNPDTIGFSGLFFPSLGLYLTGFASSLFYLGSVFSGLLMTLGLSGIFLALWNFIKKIKRPELPNAIVWIGKASFPVFLIHQPLLQKIAGNFSGETKTVLLLLVIVILFPLGYFLDRAIRRTIQYLSNGFLKPQWMIVKYGWTISFALSLGYLATGFEGFRKAFILYAIAMALIYLIILLGHASSFRKKETKFAVFCLAGSLITGFLLSFQWVGAFWIILILVKVFMILFNFRLGESAALKWSILATLLLICGTEFFLYFTRPVENHRRWGEFPALRTDSQTIYSLIPDKVTKLRYNRYAYTVKTNVWGFNASAINASSNHKKIFIIGDAFTMPEGLNREKGYPFLLQQGLKNILKADVISGGVTGYGPIEESAELKKFLPVINPDIVIYQCFINDFEEMSLSPSDRLISIGFNDLSWLSKPFYYGQSAPQLMMFVQEYINPVTRRLYNEKKSFAYLYDKKSSIYASPKAVNQMDSILSEMNSTCLKESVRFAVLFVPGQIAVSSPINIKYFPYHLKIKDTTRYDMTLPNKVYHDICQKHNIPFWDPTNDLRKNPVQPVYFTDSWHWNEAGHICVANFLKECLVKNDFLYIKK